MFEKNKYDVMDKEKLKGSTNLLLLVGKASKILNSYDKDNNDSLDKDFEDLVRKILPCIETIMHIDYENSLDLDKIDDVSLVNYLKKNGLSFDEFSVNYFNRINKHARILLGFGVVSKEGIDIAPLVKPKHFSMMMKDVNKGVIDFLSGIDVEMSLESKRLMDKVMDDSFRLDFLTLEEKCLLDEYHDMFMKKNIYSKLNKSDVSKEQVMKYAKSLGKKK